MQAFGAPFRGGHHGGGRGGWRGGRGPGHGYRRGGWWPGPWYGYTPWYGEPVYLSVDKCAPGFRPEDTPSFINGRPVIVQWMCGNRVLNGTDGLGAFDYKQLAKPMVIGGALGGAAAGYVVGGGLGSAILGALLGGGGGFAASKLTG